MWHEIYSITSLTYTQKKLTLEISLCKVNGYKKMQNKLFQRNLGNYQISSFCKFQSRVCLFDEDIFKFNILGSVSTNMFLVSKSTEYKCSSNLLYLLSFYLAFFQVSPTTKVSSWQSKIPFKSPLRIDTFTAKKSTLTSKIVWC